MDGVTFHEETFEFRAEAEDFIGDIIADAGRKEALERMFTKPAE